MLERARSYLGRKDRSFVSGSWKQLCAPWHCHCRGVDLEGARFASGPFALVRAERGEEGGDLVFR